jgi:ribose transport system substrate-binding protein
MPRRGTAIVAVLAAMTLAAAACSSTKPSGNGPSGAPSSAAAGNAGQPKFFNQADLDRQLAQRNVTPQGDPTTPWLQMINPTMVDTSKYAKPNKKWHVCFSNASVSNPWRVTGLTTMKEEVKLHPEISDFTVVDAEGKDDKQISDIADLQTKNCDALIVAPNTTDALTPAVERACQTGIPVVIFDRGVTTNCPVSFVHPIGGYAFGASDAEFIASQVGKGGKVLALRILPGVDVLENRWAGAKYVFDKAGVNVVGVEFNDADPAKAKNIVTDYIQRFPDLKGVWLDAGFGSIATVEAFQDAGKPLPALSGEDEQDFLELWKKDKLNAIAATYPVYQWRTAIIAVSMILSGKQVPKEWVLPQPVITSDNLDQWLVPGMPPLFYSSCGCEKMPSFPQAWGGK